MRNDKREDRKQHPDKRSNDNSDIYERHFIEAVVPLVHKPGDYVADDISRATRKSEDHGAIGNIVNTIAPKRAIEYEEAPGKRQRETQYLCIQG